MSGLTNTSSQLGDGINVTNTLTVTNGVYTVADVVGGLITIPLATRRVGGSSFLVSLELNGVVAIAYELWLFNADIATPRLDHAVFGLAAADALKHLGTVPIGAADYNAAQTAFNAATIRNIALQVQSVATTSIYAYLKALEVTSPGTTTLYLTTNWMYIN